jgi:hypothetical protein
MKSILTKIQILSLLIALPAFAENADVGLHNSSAQPTRASGEMFGSAGICVPVSSMTSMKGVFGSISPASDSELVFDEKSPAPVEKDEKYFDTFDKHIEKATVEVLQPQMHGELGIGHTGPHSYQYTPTGGYKGTDKVVFLVNIAGKNIKVIYFFKVLNTKIDIARLNEVYRKYCPDPYQWVISSGQGTQPDIQSLLTYAGISSSSVQFRVADLPGGAVGQTTGTTITLDDNATGYNWFIDTTPARVGRNN